MILCTEPNTVLLGANSGTAGCVKVINGGSDDESVVTKDYHSVVRDNGCRVIG